MRPSAANTGNRPAVTLTTDRLALRPTTPADAQRAFEIQSDWDVTRMLRMAQFPPDPDDMTGWFGEHRQEWIAGTAFRFAIERRGRMIGLVDLDGIDGEEGELGYWLEKPSWGQGYAFEAAQAVVSFAFEQVGLARLKTGHAADNPASGKVLLKLGFRPEKAMRKASRSRGEEILHQSYNLASEAWRNRSGADR
ncbi:GNAT family N-acetyltransferase [Ensifer adhaerens]|uniref:GNAT family N-acetyltransferase n=1 Tax=Ensifer adhaerens TaxID=106592 RepID=UPI000DD7065C|nr:GNAT family N-acetyltransferase [Ensifer adhaerens]UTV35006.1 GNAT family N-acetyltransferase [Ensifer adhaerens]